MNQAANLHQQDFLKPREVAAILRVSMGKLGRMRREGTAPAHIRHGRMVRYPVASFEAWLTEHMNARHNAE